MTGRIYRTLREANTLSDYVNNPEAYLRAPRKQPDNGHLDTTRPSADYTELLCAELERQQRDDRSPFGFFGMLICAVFVGLATWAALILLFSWSTK